MRDRRIAKAADGIAISLLRLGIYIRVSEEEQARSGHSVEFREQWCLEWCRLRHGGKRFAAQAYRDEGKTWPLRWPPEAKGSGYRGGLTKLVRGVGEGKIDCLLISRLDRLTRSSKLTHTLLEDVFLRQKIGLTSITEGFDASTKEGRGLARFSRLVNSYVCVGGAVDARKEQGESRYEQRRCYLQVGRERVGYGIEVPSSDLVGFNNTVTATSVSAFNAGGVRAPVEVVGARPLGNKAGAVADPLR